MNKKLLKKLVEQSYSNDVLDAKKVSKIAELLSRKQLKIYIAGLKQHEFQNRVVVVTPKELSPVEKKSFQVTFAKKSLEFTVDPSIITGVKIINADVITEQNLAKTFEDMLQTISQ